MNIKEQIGQNIQNARKQKGLSQEEFAHRIGISVASISSIERGVNGPSISTIEKISNLLEIPIAEFYNVHTDSAEKQSEEINSSSLLRQQIITQIVESLNEIKTKDLKVVLKQIKAFGKDK